MADLTIPHVFHDGPGNVASGEQVSDNFAAIQAYVNALNGRVWAAQAFRWYVAVAQSQPRGNSILWDGEDFDVTTAGVAPGVNFVVPTAGVWRFGWRIQYGTSVSYTGGKFYSELRVNAVVKARGNQFTGDMQAATNEYMTQGSSMANVTVGQQVSISFQSSSADPQALEPGADRTFFEGHLIRPA